VLHHFGIQLSEKAIGEARHTTPLGTDREETEAGLVALGFKAASFKEAVFDTITQHLQTQRPVIVFLSVNHLPYAVSLAGMHAVVVNSCSPQSVSFIDPAR